MPIVMLPEVVHEAVGPAESAAADDPGTFE